MSDLRVQNLPARSTPNISTVPSSTATNTSTGGSSSGSEAISSPQRVAPQVFSPVTSVSSTTSGVNKAEITQPSLSTPGTKNGNDTVQPDSPVNVAISPSSNIMSYRDSETGRLIIRLIDKDNNAVISEFPSKTMLGNYPKIGASSAGPRFDTEA